MLSVAVVELAQQFFREVGTADLLQHRDLLSIVAGDIADLDKTQLVFVVFVFWTALVLFRLVHLSQVA